VLYRSRKTWQKHQEIIPMYLLTNPKEDIYETVPMGHANTGASTDTHVSIG
jgi:hypothetical protein